MQLEFFHWKYLILKKLLVIPKNIFYSIFQSFETQEPHAEWQHVFEKTKKNDGAKMYKLRVIVSHFIIFLDYKIAEGKLDVEITSKWDKLDMVSKIIFF